MCSKGLLRRMLPFLATFGVGILIASIFVPLGRPDFGYRGHGRDGRRFFEQIQRENEELKNDNLRLRNQLENQQSSWESFHQDGMRRMHNVGPEVPVVEMPMPAMPPAPPAPHTHR